MNIRRGMARAFVVFALAVFALSWATATYGQSKKSDIEAIETLVAEYTRYEDAGDMMSQSKLMTPDRWWHGIGGRRVDNALNMKVQDEAFAAARKRYPGLQTIREVRDLKTKLIAPNVAVSSFMWYPYRIIPGDLPQDKVTALGPAPLPYFYSVVWVREGDGWKITSTHNSPLYLR